MARFPKIERKISLTFFTELYRNGSVVYHHPYKLFYILRPTPYGGTSGYKIVISVPKRNIKQAVDRNRIKRQIRESFRLNYSNFKELLVSVERQIDLLCIYLPNEHTASTILSKKMASLLERLSVLVSQDGNPPSSRSD